MTNRLRTLFFKIVGDDLKVSQLLFVLVGSAFLLFALFAANAPLDGPIPHRLLNAFLAFIGFLFYFISAFNQRNTKLTTTLVTIFIYCINLINVYLLYGTRHMDMYAYQFIVSYVISSYFFGSKKEVLNFISIINIGVFLTAFASHTNSAGVADFYMTYIASQIVFLVIYRYRFIMEERLVEKEKRYRLLAENSIDLICIHNVSARLEFVSPSIKRLLGFEPEELLGRFPREFIHPDDVPVFSMVNFRSPTNEFIGKPLQFRFRTKQGDYLWFETIFSMVEEEDGAEKRVISQSRDIRRSKKYQLELEERGRELERSNADLETFAFVSSHDMQEPLRMISNYTQLLKKRYSDRLDSDAVEYIDFANKGAVHLQQLIRDLLAYSRITRTEMQKMPVNMRALVMELEKNLQIEIAEKQARVIYNGLHNIEADKNLTMLVMQNLILNGIKYNRSAQPQVKISSVISDREVVFTIEDNGIGIDQNHQHRIFEPFHRLHTKAEYPGTGLGLSICKKIIERSGGKIWVESEVNKGSRFCFSLPAN